MTAAPVLLECFSKAGGAVEGYLRAGFRVIAVDKDPQPNCPGQFVQGDVFEVLPELIERYRPAVITGGPPCHDHSDLASLSGKDDTAWMLPAFRALCIASGLPYVIENVEGADMPGALTLCGYEFGLGAVGRVLKRHRLFESNVFLMGAGGCEHPRRQKIGGVYGTGGGGQMNRGYKFHYAEACEAMGIDWMTKEELSQAIPPAYTRFIGEQLTTYLGRVEK